MELQDLSEQTGSTVEEMMGDMRRDQIRSYMVQSKVLDWLAGIVMISGIE